MTHKGPYSAGVRGSAVGHPEETEATARLCIERIRQGESLAALCREMGLNFGNTWQRLSKPDLFPEYEQASPALICGSWHGWAAGPEARGVRGMSVSLASSAMIA